MATTTGISQSVIMGSDFVYDHICTLCFDNNGKNTEAAYYCPKCDVYYCRPCVQGACEHGILGRAEMGKWGRPDSTDSVNCREHPGNVIQLYCKNHETVGCQMCMLVNHKLCTKIKYIPESPVEDDTCKIANFEERRNQKTKAKLSEMLSSPQASKVRVTGPGVEHGLLSNFVSKFKAETHGAGFGQLCVKIMGPKGSFRVKLRRESEHDRNIYCQYNPAVSGLYVINVTWSSVHVPGSPFQIHICDTPEELERIRASNSRVQNRPHTPSRIVGYFLK